jgi:DNA modification methylase
MINADNHPAKEARQHNRHKNFPMVSATSPFESKVMQQARRSTPQNGRNYPLSDVELCPSQNTLNLLNKNDFLVDRISHFALRSAPAVEQGGHDAAGERQVAVGWPSLPTLHLVTDRRRTWPSRSSWRCVMTTTEITTPAKGLTKELGARSRELRRKRKDLVALEAIAAAPRRNDLLPQFKLERHAVTSLRAPTRALRQVRPEHIAEIARSMSMFGLVEPVLIAADGTIIDGVSTIEAAKTIGLGIVPCVVIDHLKPEEVRLLRLALNRLGEKGSWDLDELKVEFEELLDIGAPIEVTGFTLPEIDIVVMQDEPVVDQAANDVAYIMSDVPVVSKLGDAWQLGRHRLLCADATKQESYAQLFGEAPLARAVFTDPPYNIQIDGFAVGAGSIKHREFVAGSGEMTDDEFDTFLANFLACASAHLVDGGVLFVCMDWRHAEHVQRAARRAKLEHINTVVWSKGNGGLGGLYRSAHEFVLVLKKGNGPSVNNVELGKHGRDRTNVWTYPGANQRGSSANAELTNHPTPKPLELVADALLDVSRRDDIVIDPFAGSGTTVIAAEKSGRTAFVMELDPQYVDLIIRRFLNFTGIEAVHKATGKSFAQIAEERRAEAPKTGADPESAASDAGVSQVEVPNPSTNDLPASFSDAPVPAMAEDRVSAT